MKTLLALSLTVLTHNVFGQSIDTTELKNAFHAVQQINSKVNQQNYFDLFPDSFKSFEQTFGYDHVGNKPAPLYDGHYYIPAFIQLDTIPLEVKINKWINISIGGSWDADAVSYFQHGIRPRILKNVDLTCSLLKTRTDQEIECFFYFFFNEIHPQYEQLPIELSHIKSNDPEFYSLVEHGLQKAIEDSEQ